MSNYVPSESANFQFTPYPNVSRVTINKNSYPTDSPYILVNPVYAEYIRRDLTSIVEFKIYDWLRCCDNNDKVILSPTWLSKYLNVGHSSIYRALDDLRKKGYLVKDENGNEVFIDVPTRIVELVAGGNQ